MFGALSVERVEFLTPPDLLSASFLPKASHVRRTFCLRGRIIDPRRAPIPPRSTLVFPSPISFEVDGNIVHFNLIALLLLPSLSPPAP